MRSWSVFTGFCSLVILLCSYSGVAQSYFQEVYRSSPYNQEGQDVLPTSDGGYLIAGYTTNSILYDHDVLVIKTNALGKEQWRKTIGGSKPDFPYHMLATTDGNFFIVGYSQSYGGGDYDILLIKINSAGTILWQKTYGSWGNDIGHDIIKTNDGNYLIVGSSNSDDYDDQNANLIKITPAGSILWSKFYGGSADDFGNSVKQTSDGGYILLGQTFSYGSRGDAYLVKVNSSGDTAWTKRYGGAYNDDGVYITNSGDGGYVFVMRDSSNAGKDVDISVVKVNAGGAIQWKKVYGGDKKDTPKMIQRTSDGGFIIAGHSRSFGWINPDMWILKCNNAGDTLWTRHYGGYNHEHCYVVREQSDGSYIAVGKTDSYGPDFDAIFLKLSSKGTMIVGMEPLVQDEKNIIVYPNPASDKIRIDFNGLAAEKIYLRSVNGAEIISEIVDAQTAEFDLSDKPDGIYFVSVVGREECVTRKVVVCRP